MAKILIIDDDPDMVLATRMCLEGAGHEVISAPNGAEGLKLVKSGRPDLIVLDVMMDSATEGFQVALALRKPEPGSEFEAFRSIPIVMLTAIHSTTPLRFGPEQDYLPVDAFVDKPIKPDDFLAKVNQLLEGVAKPG
jgi:CheY-like chemotaxis protein